MWFEYFSLSKIVAYLVVKIGVLFLGPRRFAQFLLNVILIKGLLQSKKKEFSYWWEFLYAMTEKEVKSRYKHTLLGFLWVILNPVLQMVVIGFIFQFFVPVSVDNYFLFLFTGLLPWTFFSLSLNKATPSIVYERALIQKAYFPREAIVISIILSNLFHLLVSLLVLLVFMGGLALVSSFSLHINVGVLILAVVTLSFFTIGLSLLTAALNVKYRDISFVIQAILPLWFYATPIIYTVDLFPKQLHQLFYLNPMTAIIELFHYSLLGSASLSAQMLLMTTLVIIVTFGIGSGLFYYQQAKFSDWL